MHFSGVYFTFLLNFSIFKPKILFNVRHCTHVEFDQLAPYFKQNYYFFYKSIQHTYHTLPRTKQNGEKTLKMDLKCTCSIGIIFGETKIWAIFCVDRPYLAILAKNFSPKYFFQNLSTYCSYNLTHGHIGTGVSQEVK